MVLPLVRRGRPQGDAQPLGRIPDGFATTTTPLLQAPAPPALQRVRAAAHPEKKALKGGPPRPGRSACLPFLVQFGSKSGEFGSKSASSGSKFGSSWSMFGELGSKSASSWSKSGSSGSMFEELGSMFGSSGSKSGSSGSMFAEFGSMFGSSGSKSGEFGSKSASSGSMFEELGSKSASSGSKSGEFGSMFGSSGSMFAELGSKSGAFGSKCGGPGAAGRGECGQYIYGIGGAGWQRWAAGRLAGLRRRDMGAHCTRLGQGPLRENPLRPESRDHTTGRNASNLRRARGAGSPAGDPAQV